MFVRGQNSGGEKQGTSIWTNPYSPTGTSAWTSTQAAITQSLSRGLSNFTEIKLRYRVKTTDATEMYVKVDPATLGSSNTRFLFGGNDVGVGVMARFFTWASDTTFTLSIANQLNGTRTDDTAFIPLEIIGY